MGYVESDHFQGWIGYYVEFGLMGHHSYGRHTPKSESNHSRRYILSTSHVMAPGSMATGRMGAISLSLLPPTDCNLRAGTKWNQESDQYITIFLKIMHCKAFFG